LSEIVIVSTAPVESLWRSMHAQPCAEAREPGDARRAGPMTRDGLARLAPVPDNRDGWQDRDGGQGLAA
jgi:hypothetical protein